MKRNEVVKHSDEKDETFHLKNRAPPDQPLLSDLTNQPKKKKNLLSSYINKELSQTPLLRPPPPPPPSPSAAAARFLPSPTVSPRRRSLPLLRHPSLPPDRPSLSATETAPGSVPIRVVAASDGFFFFACKVGRFRVASGRGEWIDPVRLDRMD